MQNNKMQNSKLMRVAQFLPFDALKGLQDELRKREYHHSREMKREISEEKKQKISAVLMKLEKGSGVKVTYYFDQHYFVLHGCVNKISYTYKFLVVEDIKIFFTDIYEISLISL